MRNPGEGEWLTQGHTTRKWQNRDLDPRLPDGKPRAFSTAGAWDVNDGHPFPSPPTPSANWTFPLGGPSQGGLMSQEAKPRGGRRQRKAGGSDTAEPPNVLS